MPETMSNIEMAHRIHEQGHSQTGPHSPRTVRLEILEAITLSAVAILTAWSSYQAASWDGKRAARYVQSASARRGPRNSRRSPARSGSTTSRRSTVAGSDGDRERGAAAAFERRFRPEYAVAFAAWLKTDPQKNAKAPTGAIFMDEYRNGKLDEAKRLADEAKRISRTAQPIAGSGTRTSGSPCSSQPSCS